MSDADARLAALLGTEPPAGVSALDSDARAALADLLADARLRQAAALEAAFTETVRHVPLPVRGLARKVLLG